MSELSLSRLYRRLTSTAAQSDVDATDLADVAAGSDSGSLSAVRRDAIVVGVATSAPHAALMRMLTALKPASVSLAESVNERRRTHAHPLRVREMRPAAVAPRGQIRRLRWAGGIAACACAAVILGMWTHQHEQAQRGIASNHAQAASTSDRIFTSRDEIFASSDNGMHRAHSRAPGGDELFHGSFSAGG